MKRGDTYELELDFGPAAEPEPVPEFRPSYAARPLVPDGDGEDQFCERTPPSRLRACEYVVVDVETTGGSLRYGHRITEVAAVCMDGRGRVLEELRSLVNPERPIPRLVTALTNITNDMVQDAPRFDEIAPALIRILEHRVFVAHNAGFDLQFVGGELVITTGYVLDPRVLCTMRLARKLVPEVSSRSLDALSYYFGIENEARHRAYGDARATTHLLRRLLDRLDEREVEDWEALQRFLRARRPRRKRRSNPESMEWT